MLFSAEDEQSWVVVVTVSKWYDDFFQNWFYWFKKLQTNMTVILIAEDEFILKRYHDESNLKVHFFDMKKVKVRFCILMGNAGNSAATSPEQQHDG